MKVKFKGVEIGFQVKLATDAHRVSGYEGLCLGRRSKFDIPSHPYQYHGHLLENFS